MTGLAWNDFSDKAGQTYDVEAPGGPYALVLSAAAQLSDSGREGGSFRLEFTGPADQILPQATYRLSADGRAFDIFIVPIGRNEHGTRYEAIFY
ncbi:MAG: hypothetical protein J7500_17530 [Sphingomonas sp.]|uniref:DUF6916 family protein n=1 Tax=Sphingomonas sp. TaxID=28214 RepID=UPI001B09F12A|nr:hypothetical protein [Sphingomonas sp.]MBO9624513.1 hypothetical protein [Sphingomonas sp.]